MLFYLPFNGIRFRVKVTFILRDGQRQEVKAKVGDNLLDIIVENNVDIDGFGQFLFVIKF